MPWPPRVQSGGHVEGGRWVVSPTSLLASFRIGKVRDPCARMQSVIFRSIASYAVHCAQSKAPCRPPRQVRAVLCRRHEHVRVLIDVPQVRPCVPATGDRVREGEHTVLAHASALHASCAFWSADDGGGPLYPTRPRSTAPCSTRTTRRSRLQTVIRRRRTPRTARPLRQPRVQGRGDVPTPHAPRHRSTNCRIGVDVTDASCVDFTTPVCTLQPVAVRLQRSGTTLLSVRPGSSATGRHLTRRSLSGRVERWRERRFSSRSSFLPNGERSFALAKPPVPIGQEVFCSRAHEGNRTERTPCRRPT